MFCWYRGKGLKVGMVYFPSMGISQYMYLRVFRKYMNFDKPVERSSLSLLHVNLFLCLL